VGDGAALRGGLSARPGAPRREAALARAIAAPLAARFATSVAVFAALPFLALDLLVEWRLSPADSALATAAILIAGRLGGGLFGGLVDRRSPRIVQVWALVVPLVLCAAALWLHRPGGALGLVAFAAIAVASTIVQISTRAMLALKVDAAALPSAFAMLAVAANLGMAVGPVGGVLVRHEGAGSLAFSLSAVALALALVATLAGPGGRPDRRPRGPVAEPGPPPALRAPGEARLFAGALLLQLLAWAMIQQIFVALPWYAAAQGQPGALALFYLVQSVTVILLLPVAGAALRGAGERMLFHLYAGGTLALALSFPILGLGGYGLPATIIAFALALTLSEAVSVPAGDALVARLGREEPGRAFGRLTIACALGMAAGSLLAFALLRLETILALPPLYWWWSGAAFCAATLLVWGGAAWRPGAGAAPAGGK
jgi:hypothetical protein